ncbi:MAG TPA: pyrimidine-nucleoside phosphorylase, partial [Candidatus Acetothermia bacterium]|nr:pyrimidine-nucleoside phosphorylase [Candidatus Acetothermia bacterium]
KFVELVAAQGGDVACVEDPERLPRAKEVVEVPAPRSGYVLKLSARKIGQAAGLLGAGRETKGQTVDPAAGVELLAKVGDEVIEGEPLARLHVGRKERTGEASALVASAFEIGPEPPPKGELILARIRE